ncbi:MAG: cation:proton antiporter domain-containing protein [Planctomycetota bacterium]|jgi:predicted Kef-type K+ transport protein
MNELFWVGPALVFGLLAARVGLPPMVGYLIGGFVLNVYDLSDAAYLKVMGDLGVTLLLFTIGLKLDVRSLLKPYVWAGASLHILTVVLIFGIALFWISLTGLSLFAEVNFKVAMLIAFALSFSSTVFAVKTLEDKGELSSRHGQIAIGILIMQDTFAVVFLALSTGKIPSIWALALLALFPLRRLLMRYMTQSGHGELLILYGLGMAFGAWTLFDLVGMKGDLGALFIGALLAAHPAAGEMSKKLMGFKDILLVGFFLGIGTTGHIKADTLLIAMLLAVVVIVKVALYFVILVRFRLRANTSVLTSLSLANYSEFGLIVGAVALANGWLSGDWLVIIALALTMTFMVAAPLNAMARKIVSAIQTRVSRYESARPLPEDDPIDPGDARFAIIGMARLGAGAYDTLKAKYGDVLFGTDPDPSVVARHRAAGRNVFVADVTDDDFWFRIQYSRVEAVLLAMNEYEENLGTARRIRSRNPEGGFIFAVADYPEQSDALRAAGVTAVWDLDTEAGTGFAEDVISHLGVLPDTS